MTEYELTALLHAVVGNVVAVQGLYFSAITAYLIVAYMVGAKLSRAQVLMVTAVFSLFSFLLLGSIGRLSSDILRYRQQIEAIDSELNQFVPLPVGPPAFGVVATFALAYLMALIFMVQIRRRARSR